MQKNQYQITVAKLLALGVPLVSMFLLTGSVTDPVNLTKFLVLGAVGTAGLLLVLTRGRRQAVSTSRTALVVTGLFLLFSINAVIFSDSPISQNLYGVYGRNTGFLTYFFLIGVMLCALTLADMTSFKKMFFALFITGTVNIAYCGWVIFFGDFIGWNNPYGNILGLFGNPNFIGAFLGIWISATVGYFLVNKHPVWQLVLVALLVLLAMYEVYESHAVQGVVVTAAGLSTVLFYFIRSKTKGWLVTSVYSSGVISFGIVAALGALQKGPLAEYIYKTSVSLRGAYWNAGIQSGLSHPFTGVGMDSYGDWYRRSRSEYAATVLPGPTTVTNSAHNVFLDFFSYGGFPLFISYVGLVALGGWAIVTHLRRTRIYEPVFVGLSVAWVGYQLQSIISINQIGLAVWGWVLTGALIAYESVQRKLNEASKTAANASNNRSKQQSEFFSSPLIAGLGAVLGLILACPPISADMAWMKATKSGNFLEVQKALTPSYLRPSDSQRLAEMALLLENSKLYDQARDYALRATKHNPDYTDAWFALYSVKNSTSEEKRVALKNLKRLDPFNPDVTSR
jgi:O-antigen ligase